MFVVLLRICSLVLVATIITVVLDVSECIELKRLSALSTSTTTSTTTTTTSTTTTIAPSPTTVILPSSSAESAATTVRPPTSTTTSMVDSATTATTTTSAPMQQILVFNEKTQIFELVPNISLNAIVVDFDPIKDLDKSMGRVLGGGGDDDDNNDDGGGGFSLNCLNCDNGMPAMNSSLCGCKSNTTVVDPNMVGEVEPKSIEVMSTTTTTAAPATRVVEESQTTTTMAPMTEAPKPKPTRTWDAPKRLRNWNPSKSMNPSNSWDLGKRTRTWDTPRRIATTATPAPVQTIIIKKPEPKTRAKIIVSSNSSGFNSNRDHSRPRIKASRRKQPKPSNPNRPKNPNGGLQCQYVACISPCYIFRTSLDECPECSCPEFNRFDKIKFFATSSFEPSFNQDRFKNRTFN